MAALAQGPPLSAPALSDRLLKFTGQFGALAEDIHRISRHSIRRFWTTWGWQQLSK